MSSTVPPITPRSANTSRAASMIRWRVASRRIEPGVRAAGGFGIVASASGAGAARRIAGVRRRAATAAGWSSRRGGLIELSARGSARARARACPSRPPSPPVAARAPSHHPPPFDTCVSDTLTYRIRLRILASCGLRCNPSADRNYTGTVHRAHPGEATDVRAPGLLDLPVPVPDRPRVGRRRRRVVRLGAVASRARAPRTRPRSCPPNSPSVQARDALERAFPGSTANSSASITFDRATGLTDADRAYLADVRGLDHQRRAPPELRGRRDRHRERRLPPGAEAHAPERRRPARAPDRQP